MLKQFILVLIAVFGFVGQASGSDRRSLVMFISGGIGQGNSVMRNLCNEYESRISARNGKAILIRQSAVNIWDSSKNKDYTHIALVGHSLGGHTAYRLAKT